jgi:isopentenyldiphosphate isomerase
MQQNMNTSPELWQLYDEQGRALPGQGETKDVVFTQGLLHGAAHVWMWRMRQTGPEVLLQKRASIKRTWPDCYDISAAGHIDLNEDPITAAIREADEEIGLATTEDQLQLIAVHRAHLVTPTGDLENEFQWVYTLHVPEQNDFVMQEIEVASMEWRALSDFAQQTAAGSDEYVPHGSHYYGLVAREIGRVVDLLG